MVQEFEQTTEPKYWNLTCDSSPTICATEMNDSSSHVVCWVEVSFICCLMFFCVSLFFFFLFFGCPFIYTLVCFLLFIILDVWLFAFLSSSSIAGWCKGFWMLGRKMTKSSKSLSSICCHWFISSVSLTHVWYSHEAHLNILCCFSMFVVCLFLLLADCSFSTFISRAEGGRRRGNMGHLTRIANTVVQNLEKGLAHSQINDLIKGLLCRNMSKEPHILWNNDAWDRSVITEIIITCISTELPEDCRGRWEGFVGETLRETNRRNTVDLVSKAFTKISLHLLHRWIILDKIFTCSQCNDRVFFSFQNMLRKSYYCNRW